MNTSLLITNCSYSLILLFICNMNVYIGSKLQDPNAREVVKQVVTPAIKELHDHYGFDDQHYNMQVTSSFQTNTESVVESEALLISALTKV